MLGFFSGFFFFFLRGVCWGKSFVRNVIVFRGSNIFCSVATCSRRREATLTRPAGHVRLQVARGDRVVEAGARRAAHLLSAVVDAHDELGAVGVEVVEDFRVALVTCLQHGSLRARKQE